MAADPRVRSIMSGRVWRWEVGPVALVGNKREGGNATLFKRRVIPGEVKRRSIFLGRARHKGGTQRVGMFEAALPSK